MITKLENCLLEPKTSYISEFSPIPDSLLILLPACLCCAALTHIYNIKNFANNYADWESPMAIKRAIMEVMLKCTYEITSKMIFKKPKYDLSVLNFTDCGCGPLFTLINLKSSFWKQGLVKVNMWRLSMYFYSLQPYL